MMVIRICTIFIALVLLFGAWPGPVNAQNANIPDTNLRAAVQEGLGRARTSTATITVSSMANIVDINGNNLSISNLTGLEHATGLQRLHLRNNNITNIDSLYASTNLQILDLSENNITNIGVLSKLTSLTSLNLFNNNITNIDSLYTLTNLRTLEAGRNRIANIDSLSNLTELRGLLLNTNRVSDLSPLRSLTRLEYLGLGNNGLTNARIAPLQSLTSLNNYLTLSNNIGITNLDSLSTLTNLRRLELTGNVNLSDLSPISTLTELTHLTAFYCNLSDLSPVSNFTNLISIDIRLNFIRDISALSNLTDLQFVYISTNFISDLSPLVSNPGVGGTGDIIRTHANPLSATSRNTHVPALRARGGEVRIWPEATLVLSSSAIDENGATATITATLDRAQGTLPTTITVAAAPGANAVATDFMLSSNPRLTIAATATTSTGTVTITAVDNSVFSGDKTVTISADSIATWSGGGRTRSFVTPPLAVSMMIREDELGVALVLSPSEIDESGATNQSTVTATQNRAASTATTITVSAAPGANAVAGDFTLSNNPVLTIAAGATTSTGTVTITAVDNSVRSDDKAVTVSGNAQNSASVASPSDVTLTIRDDESFPGVALVLSPSEIDESGATNQTTVTATLTRASTAATTITVAAAPGANTVAGDFTLSNNPVLTIAAGATTSTGTVTITAVDNSVSAGDKTVTVSGNAQNSAGVTSPSDVTLTIRDDENPVANQVPEFTDVVDFQRYQQGTPIAPLTFPVAQGGDGALTYTLPSLPPGLTYTPPSEEDAHGGVLSGTPTETQAKATYALTATDEDEDVAQALFYIVVLVDTSSGVVADAMPSFGDATVAAQSYVQNREIEAITLPQATGGDGALTYALTPDLPEGLTFNTETRVLSGLPTEALGETTYTLTASDGDGDEATLSFALAVAEDLMPSFPDTVVAHRYLVKTEVEITFPEATGGDGVLAYILLPFLPDELEFDHETRVISGTLLQAILETEYTLSALDADGDVASLTFTLEGLTPDFDGNGRVNFADFALFVVRYGTRPGEERYNSRYDLNSDGAVGYDDFLIFSQYYDTEI